MVQMVMFMYGGLYKALPKIYMTGPPQEGGRTRRRVVFFCGDKLHVGCEARLGPARWGTDAEKFEACHAHAFVALERGRGLGDGVLGQCSGRETDPGAWEVEVREDNGHGGDGLRGHDVAGPGVAVGHGERVLTRRGAGRGRRRRKCDGEGAPVGGRKVHVLDGRCARRARRALGGRGSKDGLCLLACAAVVGVRAQKVVGAGWLWTEARGEGGAGVYFYFWLGVDAAGVAGIWQRGGEDVWRGRARGGGVRAVHVGLAVGLQPVAFYMCAPYMGVISEPGWIPDAIIPDMATAPTCTASLVLAACHVPQ